MKSKISIIVEALNEDVTTIANIWEYNTRKEEGENTKDFVARIYKNEYLIPTLESLMKRAGEAAAIAQAKPLIDAKLATIPNNVFTNIEEINE